MPANNTGAEVVGLGPATEYTFRVRARNASGDSAYTNQATATTDGPTTACVANDTTLCLNGGRFQVTVEWAAPSVGTGPGRVVPNAAPDSGLFWFFGPDNWEMLIKVLDACAAPPDGNQRYWVFFAATTNVEYLVTVIDTATGKARQYYNAQGQAAVSQNDTLAFATCP